MVYVRVFEVVRGVFQGVLGSPWFSAPPALDVPEGEAGECAARELRHLHRGPLALPSAGLCKVAMRA